MFILWTIRGFFMSLFGLWTQDEWFYYSRTGLDPRLPAYQRWAVRVHAEDKLPDSEAERLMPVKNQTVILEDKYMLTGEEVLFYSTDAGKIGALVRKYEDELRSRSCGEFYFRNIKNRQLDFFHNFKEPSEQPPEEAEIDEETRRNMFNR
ncbi:hypothetical protein IT575_05780 [bacterium]|nr:hypothetical protein [bacterium]